MKSKAKKRLIVALAFQFCWLALILSANTNYSLVITLLAIAIASAIFYLGLPKFKLLPLLVLALLGFCFDVLMHALAVISIHGNQATGHFWLLSLWLVFAFSFSFLFFWLTRLPSLVTGFIGAIGGVASYYAAAQLGALEILMMLEFIIIYASFWSLAFIISSKILIAKQLTQQNIPAQDARHK
jgi:hypothetical protein